MPDFGLLQMPNFAQAALGGYKAGQAVAQQSRIDSALGNADLTRPETLLPVLRADPSTGAALIGAAGKLADAHREVAGRSALASLILSHGKGGDPSTGAGMPSQTAAATAANVITGATPSAAPATQSPDGDVVVTAPPRAPATPQWSPEEAALIQADPEAFLKVQANIGKMDETHRAAVQDAADAQANVSLEASKLPYDQRKAFVQQQASYLRSHGVDQATIDGFDPTDGNLSLLQTQALGVKDALARGDKDRSFALDTAKFDETKRSNRVSEGQAAQRIGLEGANVVISRGNLAISQHREARETAKGGAGGIPTGIAAPTSRAAYGALASGTRFRAPDGSIRIKP